MFNMPSNPDNPINALMLTTLIVGGLSTLGLVILGVWKIAVFARRATALIHLAGSFPYAGIVVSTAMIGFGVVEVGPSTVKTLTQTPMNVDDKPTYHLSEQKQRDEKVVSPPLNGAVLGGGIGLLVCSIIPLLVRWSLWIHGKPVEKIVYKTQYVDQPSPTTPIKQKYDPYKYAHRLAQLMLDFKRGNPHATDDELYNASKHLVDSEFEQPK